MNGKSILDSLGVVGTLLKKILETWQKQEKSRQRLIIVLGLSGLVLSAALAIMLNTTRYDVLYTNLSISDAGDILAQLKDSGIDAKPQGTSTILVPSGQVDALRMELAAAGYPQNSVNLDILEKSTGFGMTDEDKQIYRRYQLQEDLQNAIETFDNVLDSRVTLNIPKSSSFVIENQKDQATAAVLLTLKAGTSLNAGNVAAISSLVEKSIPGLRPENVSIIDNNMNVLNIASGSDSGELATTDQLTLQSQIGDKLKKQVLSLLQPVFGTDKVLAEVHVTLDFDDSTIESIRFEPAEDSTSGIISSINKIRESSSGTSGGQSGTGTDSNGSGTTTYPVAGTSDSVYEKASESINYEINTIRETLTRSKGTVKNLSVSVIIDSSTDLQADYSDSVRKLVATAIGVSETYITVDRLPFNGSAAQEQAWKDYQATNEKAMQWEQTRFFILLGAGILMLLLLIVLIGKAIRGTRKPAEEVTVAEQPALTTAQRPELLELYKAFSLPDGEDNDSRETALALLNDASALQRRKIETYFDNNPELAASIIRGWINEE